MERGAEQQPVGGPESGADERDEFIIIDENSALGRRRHSIEERNELARGQAITLYPFAHQVGGHTQLLALDRATLCKPLVPRELLFYLNVPGHLARFVPAYKGVVQVGELGAGDSDECQPVVVVRQPVRSRKSPLALASRLLERNKSAECEAGATLELHVRLRPFSDEQLLERKLSQDNLLGADYVSRPNEKYLLLLENVASKYQLPCILDLKMGTRQHGDDASEEKRHRQMAKCQASTSASLGLRLCGMQVYKADYGGYLWYDKYSGRKMDERGLRRALREYFRTSCRQLGAQIVEQTIERLGQLQHAVLNSPAFRFYGTSLLIVHESAQVAPERRAPVDVRLIDFAHTICDFQVAAGAGRAHSSPSILRSEPARRQSAGAAAAGAAAAPNSAQLSERVAAAAAAAAESQQAAESGHIDTPAALAGQQIAQSDPRLQAAAAAADTEQIEATQPSKQMKQQDISQQHQTPTVTLTQTTTSCTTRVSRHSMGPDKGLLFGLENLVKLLESIRAEFSEQCSDGVSEI